MIFKSLGNCGLNASMVGLGCEHLEGKDDKTIDKVIKAALDCDINILDVFMSEPNVRSDIGKALRGCRNKVILQGHIGAVFKDGQYGRSRELADAKYFFQDLMVRLETDYIDIGMIHFVDNDEDYQRVFNGDTIEYAMELKRQGIIRAVGLSSHEPSIALKAVKTGLVDVLMFSINPAYDLLPENTLLDDFFIKDTYNKDSLLGIDSTRAALYAACEQMGVGITVMKALGGGQLLNANLSPFGEAMRVQQCIHYAITRPGVASVLVGCRTPEEVYEGVSYIHATEQERDYSAVLAGTAKYSMTGRCMYCNHCLPCPSKIDIASVTKYLDLAVAAKGDVPATVREHYHDLQTNAADCIACGNCEPNCPFGVAIIENMGKAKSIFGSKDA